MIKWPDFILAPINLWNRPLQEIDYLQDDLGIIADSLYEKDIEMSILTGSIDMDVRLADYYVKRLKHLKHIYYLRTGKLL